MGSKASKPHALVEDGKGVPQVFEKGIQICLGISFADQCQQLFGPVRGPAADVGILLAENTCFIIDLELARKIHRAIAISFVRTTEEGKTVKRSNTRKARNKTKNKFLLEGGKAIPTRFHDGLYIQLDSVFALQLQEIFGPVSNTNVPEIFEEDELAVPIDLNIARSLHELWKQKTMGACQCGNMSDFWVIRDPEDKTTTIGICCQTHDCYAEYFVEEWCTGQNENKNPSQINWSGEPLILRKPLTMAERELFQVHSQREFVRDIRNLKRGDHIGFPRYKSLYWHHGIVVQVDAGSFDVIHWSYEGGKLIIQKKNMGGDDLVRASRFVYKNVYQGEAEDKNRLLTVARAYSRLHNPHSGGGGFGFLKSSNRPVNGYGLVDSNCEHLATYCVLGQGYCGQIAHAESFLRGSVCSNFLGRHTRLLLAIELFEEATGLSELFGFLAVSVIGFGEFCGLWWNLHTLFKKSEITRHVLFYETIKAGFAFLGGVVGAGIAAAIMVGFWKIAHIKTAVTLLVLGELGLTPIAYTLGRVGGSCVGHAVGMKVIEKLLGRDERMIDDTQLLRPGDHINKGGHHGIVVQCKPSSDAVSAIMFRKKVIQEEELTSGNLRLVIYDPDDDLEDPSVAIERATALISDPAQGVSSREKQVVSCKLKLEIAEHDNAHSDELVLN